MHMRDRFARIVLFGSIIGGTKRQEGGVKTRNKKEQHARAARMCPYMAMRGRVAGRKTVNSFYFPSTPVDYGAYVHSIQSSFMPHYKAPRTIHRERETKQQRAESGSLSHMPRARSLACPRGGDGVGCDLCDARKVARLERVLRHDPGAAHAEHAPG